MKLALQVAVWITVCLQIRINNTAKLIMIIFYELFLDLVGWTSALGGQN